MFQRRRNGLENFVRPWKAYKNGFGTRDNDYWLGLHRIHRMTRSEEQVLRVDLEDWENSRRYALYETFTLANEDLEYQITVRNYSGK